MKSVLAATCVAVALLFGVASARPAGKFGFGPPLSYPEAMQAVADNFAMNLRDPDSVKALTISQPIAACHGRGHPGRREVCGYRFCVSVNAKNSFGGYTGRQVLVFWKYQGFGNVAYENQGICSANFTPWSGDPPVEAREFCNYQPKNEECEAGKRENLTTLSLEESVGQPFESDNAGTDQCTDQFRDKMREKGLTYADIDELCGRLEK